MKEIKLTGKIANNRVAIVDDDMFDFLNQFRWYVKGSPTSEYAVANVPKQMEATFKVIKTYGISKPKHSISHKIEVKKTYMHWLILTPPDGLMIDHINRNTLDNRRENLRIVTRRENRNNAKDRVILGL